MYMVPYVAVVLITHLYVNIKMNPKTAMRKT